MKERTLRFSRSKATGLYYMTTEDGRTYPCARSLSSRKKIIDHIAESDILFGHNTTVIFE